MDQVWLFCDVDVCQHYWNVVLAKWVFEGKRQWFKWWVAANKSCNKYNRGKTLISFRLTVLCCYITVTATVPIIITVMQGSTRNLAMATSFVELVAKIFIWRPNFPYWSPAVEWVKKLISSPVICHCHLLSLSLYQHYPWQFHCHWD